MEEELDDIASGDREWVPVLRDFTVLFRKLQSGGGAIPKASVEPEYVEDRVCPLCGKKLVIRFGRYGKFIGCSGFPNAAMWSPGSKKSACSARKMAARSLNAKPKRVACFMAAPIIRIAIGLRGRSRSSSPVRSAAAYW